MSIAQADVVVRAILNNDVLSSGRFRPASEDLDDLDGRELVVDRIYRYPLLDHDDNDIALTVYLGLGEVGGQMWEQELRVLQRIGSLEHPSLPVLEGGSYVRPDLIPGGDGKGAGFIRTRSHLGIPDLSALDGYFKADPAKAVRALWRLADGLALLHDSRIAHRNLWPGILEYEDTGSAEFRFLFTRFEMSSMVSNLLRGGQIDNAGADRVRPLYLNQDRRFLAYAPPERVAFLSGAPDSPGAGDLPGDVFGLGMMAAEWLLGASLLDDVPPLGPDLEKFQREVRRRVNITTELPPALSKLLHSMLDPLPSSRPTMADVMTALSKNYHGIVGGYPAETECEKPYLVAYMPEQSDRTLLAWKALSESAMTDEGRAQLVDLIESDLRKATVCHSEQGAVPFVPVGAEEDRLRAKTVMFGRNFVWFAETLYHNQLGTRKYFDNIKVIKYVLQRSRAPRALYALRDNSLTRQIFAVEAVPYRASPTELARKSKERPSWPDLVATTAQRFHRTTKQQGYLDALDWFIDYKSAQLFAREYAYVRQESDQGLSVALRWDRTRDRERARKQSAMHKKLVSDDRLRGPMADFFAESAADEPAGAMIEVCADRQGAPGDVVGTFRLAETHGREVVVLDLARPTSLPESGWLRLRRDQASRSNIWHQARAVEELGQYPVLLQALIRPMGLQGNPDRWQDAGGRLEGEGRDAVHAILRHEAMFAVQGPPGTGKTEVTSQAVADYLFSDPQARVLVSAQSHDALDNLAARILKKIEAVDDNGTPTPTDWLALRIAGEFTERHVSAPVNQFMPDEVVPRLQRSIERKITGGQGVGRFDDPRIRDILQLWLRAVSFSGPEIRTRVRRGANVVFATTGASTRSRLVDQGSSELFDWVVIEEAAKAWPTELAMPLVRGTRWTLVGDQAQIGAFARQDVERFLGNCREDPDPEVARWWESRSTFIDAFDTFKRMFSDPRPDAPRKELTEQRRMRKPIAEVVSNGFYAARRGGGLVTMRPEGDHGIVQPPWLRGQAMVWIDTGTTQDATGFWYNEVEAALVARLVRSLRPSIDDIAGREKGKALAIVTPYRRQVSQIQMKLTEHADDVWTVDSFQGREARIVVASLVRDRDPHAHGHGLGHVAEPARANVLLSRARDLLVVIGRIACYEHCGVPEWQNAVAAVREFGKVVPMSYVAAS
ncbi:AAA domain-containing protein [Actinokineospora sp. UTMC 2448]|uniref:AAA domain-containing protein n=1 Tax=Actinokineospora sp. UTMC 2448 TaxID=2268449 RepID=UPI002164BBDE|nr:AAA domain-containing protein [Actinokineospora sp. UTMC 2448]UVS78598.1 putative DNA helicase [Actinokineospora sp. UTMC 2448]